ncbi:hypothetical protein ABPG72_014836 [Tetrahymena utriculariae]
MYYSLENLIRTLPYTGLFINSVPQTKFIVFEITNKYYITTSFKCNIRQYTYVFPGVQLTQSFSMNVTNDFLAFKIWENSSLVGRRNRFSIFKCIALYDEKSSDPNQKSDIIHLNFVKCEDPKLDDYNCLDFSPVSQKKLEMPLKFDNNFLGKYSIIIQIILCDEKLIQPSQKCASPSQISQEILNLETQGIMRIKTQQYDPNEQKYVEKVKHEVFSFNDFLCNVSQITLLQAVTTVNKGFIIQGQNQNTYFYDFARTHTSNTISFMKYQLGFKLVNYVQIYIGNNIITQVISYHQFTYLLAQFVSVLNTLLLIGIICKVFSENQILQLELIKELKQKRSLILKQHTIQDFYQIHFQIKNMNFKQQIGKYLNQGFFEKLKLQLIDSNNVDQQEKDKQEIKIYKLLVKQTQKQLNITELQKEIMSIQIILRLILSVEQYAAIQLCGYSILNENKIQDEDPKLLSSSYLNFYEKIQDQ